jgi:hypothetical protein
MLGFGRFKGGKPDGKGVMPWKIKALKPLF